MTIYGSDIAVFVLWRDNTKLTVDRINLDPPNFREFIKLQTVNTRGNAKINTFTSKGNFEPTSEQTKSACEDFNKAI